MHTLPEERRREELKRNGCILLTDKLYYGAENGQEAIVHLCSQEAYEDYRMIEGLYRHRIGGKITNGKCELCYMIFDEVLIGNLIMYAKMKLWEM